MFWEFSIISIDRSTQLGANIEGRRSFDVRSWLNGVLSCRGLLVGGELEDSDPSFLRRRQAVPTVDKVLTGIQLHWPWRSQRGCGPREDARADSCIHMRALAVPLDPLPVLCA